MILDDIIENKRREVRDVREKFKAPLDTNKLPETRSFTKALKKRGINIIAEVKAKSPSSGEIIKDYDPVRIAKAYETAGASAISVLTDQKYFGGKIDHLKKVKEAVNIPVLRKDFIIDEAQIYESRLAGADAILLIARILKINELERFIKIIKDLGMEALTEVHSQDEASKAIAAGADLIGINNRDLDSLKIDICTTVNIMKNVDELKGKLVVSESGIKGKADIKMLSNCGINVFLIGEAILKSGNISDKISELKG